MGLFFRLGDEENDLPNKSVFTGIDFRYSGKDRIFITNEANSANLTVGANVFVFVFVFVFFISDNSVVADNTPVASGAKIGITGTESFATLFLSKGLVARNHP